MSRFSRTPFAPRRLRLIMSLLSLTVASGLSPEARAAATRSQSPFASVSSGFSNELNKIKAFFSGGSSPRAPLNILNSDGSLKADSPVVQHLEWRRDQNPALFDRRFPKLGQALSATHPALSATAAAAVVQSPVTVSVAPHSAGYQVLMPPVTVPTDGTSGNGISTSTTPVTQPAAQAIAVPEPSGFLITMTVLGAAAGYRARQARRSRA